MDTVSYFKLSVGRMAKGETYVFGFKDQFVKFVEHKPPKEGEIALWSATNRWYVVKCDSQKRNQSIKKTQSYNILVTFIFEFNLGVNIRKNLSIQ